MCPESTPEDPDVLLAHVRAAAGKGARSVTRQRWIVERAVERVLERWEDGLLRSRELADPGRWAFRVGANAAKDIDGRGLAAGIGVEVVAPVAGDDSPPEPDRRRIRLLLSRQLPRLKKALIGRQYEVVRVLSRSGMTYHAAGKKLGMDRSNLRRCFPSALARLARLEK